MKDVSELTVSDLRKHPVWTFSGNDSPRETAVRPVKKLPVQSLSGALVGCEVRFASGKIAMALLGNLDVERPHLTEHFLTLGVFRDDGAIFHLARYHDIGAGRRGPDALATFLKMKKREIFPISWDVRHVVAGDSAALHGVIPESPKTRLTSSEIITLALS